MNKPPNSGNDGMAIVLLILVGIAGAIIVAVASFSDALRLPWNVGGEVLMYMLVAAALAVGAGYGLSRIYHPRWLLVSVLVLVAGATVAFWPALDFWAAAIPPLAYQGYTDGSSELLWWGGTVARWVYFGIPAIAAIVVTFKRDD